MKKFSTSGADCPNLAGPRWRPGQKLHQRFFANLELAHVQLDELWAKVKHSDQNVWVAYEAKFKLIPVLQLGPRTQQMAYSVVHELKSRLKPDCVPVFSSDGWKHYFYALTAHFGEWMKPDEQSQLVWTILANFAYAPTLPLLSVSRFRQAQPRPNSPTRGLKADPLHLRTRSIHLGTMHATAKGLLNLASNRKPRVKCSRNQTNQISSIFEKNDGNTFVCLISWLGCF